jgi:hypothetical protein
MYPIPSENPMNTRPVHPLNKGAEARGFTRSGCDFFASWYKSHGSDRPLETDDCGSKEEMNWNHLANRLMQQSSASFGAPAPSL